MDMASTASTLQISKWRVVYWKSHLSNRADFLGVRSWAPFGTSFSWRIQVQKNTRPTKAHMSTFHEGKDPKGGCSGNADPVWGKSQVWNFNSHDPSPLPPWATTLGSEAFKLSNASRWGFPLWKAWKALNTPIESYPVQEVVKKP
jgi:hypothetical protein